MCRRFVLALVGPVENQHSLIANPSLSMDAEHPHSTISISLFSGQKSSHFGQIIASLMYRVVHLIKEG